MDMLVLIILSKVGPNTYSDNLIIFGVIPSSPVAFDGSSDRILVIKFPSVNLGILNGTLSGSLLLTCDLNFPKSNSGPFSVCSDFSFSLIDEKKQFNFSMITVGSFDFSPLIISSLKLIGLNKAAQAARGSRVWEGVDRPLIWGGGRVRDLMSRRTHIKQ